MIVGIGAAAGLSAGALLFAAVVLLPDQASTHLEEPPQKVETPRPPRPPVAQAAAPAQSAYPPAPRKAPDFASAILSVMPKRPDPPPAPEPAKAKPEPPSEPEIAAAEPTASPSEPEIAAAEPTAAPPEPKRRVALLAPPPPIAPARPPENPPWRRYAAPTPPSHGRPQVAIVIDDIGLSRALAERAIALPAPITLAMLPYGRDLPALAREARAAGHELLVHLPMEPEHEEIYDPGPNALLMSLAGPQLDARIAWNLQRFDGFVGVNNHMGSRFTSSPQRMARLMRQLRSRGLLFLDSKTSETSVGYDIARRLGVPATARDVFLDNERTPAAIRARLAEVEEIARRHGGCVAIGHPYPETLDVLSAWLEAAAAKGLSLAPVSALVERDAAG